MYIVWSNVINSVKPLLEQIWILHNPNSINLTLILEKRGADSVEKYKPFALAKFQFKILTKIVADRLTILDLNLLFRKNQIGFTRSKHIYACTEITSETIYQKSLWYLYWKYLIKIWLWSKVLWFNLALKVCQKNVCCVFRVMLFVIRIKDLCDLSQARFMNWIRWAE